MASAPYRLKDPGTSFYDMSQQRGIVSNQVSVLEITDRVTLADREGTITKLNKEEFAVAKSQGLVAKDPHEQTAPAPAKEAAVAPAENTEETNDSNASAESTETAAADNKGQRNPKR